MLRLTDPIMDGWTSLPRGGPSYREAKGGALRPGRVAERWDKIPWFSRLVAVQCDSISTTPSSPGLSQRQRTGVSALHKPILRALHQSTIVHGENALALQWDCWACRGPSTTHPLSFAKLPLPAPQIAAPLRRHR